MKINKHKSSKSTASLQNFDTIYKQAFTEIKNSPHQESFANILNRKFIVTKYPQQSEQLLAKTISKTIKDKKKSQSRNVFSRQSALTQTVYSVRKQSNQFEREVLQSKRIKVILTKKGQRRKPSPIQRQEKLKPKSIPYQTLPIISQVNFQSKHDAVKIANQQSIQMRKRANSKKSEGKALSNIDHIMNDKNMIDGWDNTLGTSRNAQSRQYYEIQESNDLQYY